MIIRKLTSNDPVPMELLLLADPSDTLVENYLKNGLCFIAEHEQSTIGTYVLLRKYAETVEIMNLAVAPDFQGRGIGKRLIQHAVHSAKENGFKRIEIGTGNSSIGQLALYQKCGFRIIGIHHGFFTRHYVEPIFEDGIQCVDMIRLAREL